MNAAVSARASVGMSLLGCRPILVTCALFSTALLLLVGAPAASAADDTVGARYLVEVISNPSATAQATVTSDAAASVADVGGVVETTLTKVYDGLVVTLPSDEAVMELLEDPNVVSVIKDQRASIAATQVSPPSWGLDRIDQAALPLDSHYTYTSEGAGVRVYILDTGIRSSHEDFGGRVEAGRNFSGDVTYNVLPKTPTYTDDCNSHGTHVAGTVGGATSGVAKAVTLIPVRVLDCSGVGAFDDVIIGLEWVVTDMASHPGARAVVNLSIGGGAYGPVDAAVAAVVAANIPVVIAAGNGTGADACTYSPARAATAITVGATTNTDTRSSFSNIGTCLDLFAPGTSITSASTAGPTSYSIKSGTSMATPHVTGVVASYLATQPALTPAQVMTALSVDGDHGVIADAGTGSPNLLLRALHTDPVAPDAPTGVTGTAGDESAVLSWSAPASNGGSEVSGYSVYYSTDNGGSYSTVTSNTGTTATSRTVNGLTNDTTYRFAVAAVNSAGTSTKSSLSAAVTPVAPPVAPVPVGGGGGGSTPSTGGGSTPSTGGGGGGGGGSDWLVSEVRPSSGPAAGGTRALVLGYGLTGATDVTINGVSVPYFRNIDDSTVEIVTPAGPIGWQDLRVMLPHGSAPAGFQYVDGAASPQAVSPSTNVTTVASSAPTVTAKPSVQIAKPGQRVSLSVVVRANGVPVPRATVSLSAKGKTIRAITDATGTVVFKVNPQTTTRYTLNVAATASRAASQHSTVVKVQQPKHHQPRG